MVHLREVNMKTSKKACCISLVVAAMAAGVATGAHAEFRCKAPPTPEDKRACELAKAARPDELRHFIQRTSSIYGLYFYDYVTQTDADRWYAARPTHEAQSVAAVDHRD